jgi:hypothetical protein
LSTLTPWCAENKTENRGGDIFHSVAITANKSNLMRGGIFLYFAEETYVSAFKFLLLIESTFWIKNMANYGNNCSKILLEEMNYYFVCNRHIIALYKPGGGEN